MDIPSRYQNNVRSFYALWLLSSLAATLNLLLLFWYGFSSEGAGDVSFVQWALGLSYVVFALPGSWMWWYKRFYRAVQLNQQIPVLFFIFLTIHMLWAAMMALGLTLTASYSFLVMAKCFTQGHDSIAVAMMINGALWSLVTFLSLYLTRVAHRTLGQMLAEKYMLEQLQGQKNILDQLQGQKK